MLEVLDKGPGWFYYRNHRSVRLGQIKRTEVFTAVQGAVQERPATYGYRRLHYYIRNNKSIACNPKTVLLYMRLNHWLNTERNKRHHRKPPHTGQVISALPNQRWSSDILEIRCWNREKGRLAMITDCGNIEVLSYAWERSLVSKVVQKMIQEALMKRFKTERIPEGVKLQFLTDNGSEYIDKELVAWMESVGFEVCNTPVRSPERNGVSEAVNRWIRADYINQNPSASFDDVRTKMPDWIEDYNTVCPHERLGGVSAKEYYENWLKSAKKINWCYPFYLIKSISDFLPDFHSK